MPRDDQFFEQLEKVCELMVAGVTELKILLDNAPPTEERSRRIKEIEHACDEVVHAVLEDLRRTLVTPLDRQDARKLFIRLDDVLDLSEAAASRIDLYQPKTILVEARQLSDLLQKSVLLIQEMIGHLRSVKKHIKRMLEIAETINQLENEADTVRRTALAKLFRDEQDVREVIKWKDILEYIEAATDRCEDVADIVEGIIHEQT